MEKPYRHNPESSQARRNRALWRGEKRRLDEKLNRKKSRQLGEIDNTIDEGFCETLWNRGTNAGKLVPVGISFDENGRVIR